MKLPKWVRSAGFTMIELLVVIAVIGVLAVAVLSSINPIEQINKGRDTRTRSDAAQIINATDRYFSTQEEYPWNKDRAAAGGGWAGIDGAAGEEDYEALYQSNDAAYAAGPYNWVYTLSDVSEVKQGFANRVVSGEELYLYKATGPNETVYVCFLPKSNSFQLEAARNCDASAGEATTPDVDFGGGISSCTTLDGTVDEDNMICLP